MQDKIWLSSPHMNGGEQKYIQEAFDTNWIAPLGGNVDGFEKELKSYIGDSKQVVAVNSGTSALHLALILAGVSIGDEVICQSFTFCASANPILYVGATPVFVDSEKETWNLCPILLEKAILERKKKGKIPKAIIAVHSYGMPFKEKEIKKISTYYNIPIIEDAASALGSKINEQYCGTFGDFAIFSFNGNKIITTSGGGALICKNTDEKRSAIFFANQAREEVAHYEHSKIGYNFRMSNILAGIGRGQLEVIEDRVLARRANFYFYKKALTGIADFQFIEAPVGHFSNRWMTNVLTASFDQREQLRLVLEANSIEARPLWKPMHQQLVFKNFPSYLNGVSDELFERGLSLPSGSNLTERALSRVVNIIKDLKFKT